MTTTKRRPKKGHTRTQLPPTPEGRYRAAWGTSAECAHRWAANQTPEGRAGNVFFRHGTVYSYGSHFPMARHVTLPDGTWVVFFTTRGYSTSTSRHLGEVRQAIPRGTPVYRVDDVQADDPAAHRANVKAIRGEVEGLVRKAGKARQAKGRYLAEAADLIRHANAYAAAVGIKDRLTAPDGEDLEAWSERVKTEDAAREKRELAAKTRKAAKELAEYEQRLAAWKDGGEWPGYHPAPWLPGSSLVQLRLKGRVVETTMRAAVPLRAVLPVLKAVRAGEQLADGFTVDSFKLEGIDHKARTVVVGCHTVSFDEIERLAAKHGY